MSGAAGQEPPQLRAGNGVAGDATTNAGEVVDEPELSVQDTLTAGEPKLSPPRQIDRVRAGLAWAFTVIFAGTIVFAFLITTFAGRQHAEESMSLFKTILPAETAVLGSAVGFYFGSRER